MAAIPVGKHSPLPTLLVTTRTDLSADLLVVELGKLSAPCVRWNQEDFPLRSHACWSPDAGEGFVTVGGESYPLSGFRGAWYRRAIPAQLPSGMAEGAIEFAAREAAIFLEGLWETSHWFWVNRPLRVRAAENKLAQLALARHLGFPVPRTIVTNDPSAAIEFVRSAPQAIVKSVSASRADVDGDSWALFTHSVSESDLGLREAVQVAPCIFQECLARKSDVRVTVVGRQVFAAEIFMRGTQSTCEVDWRAVDRQDLCYQPHNLPPALEALCHSMLASLELRYGCFDFIRTADDRYVFLEVNPSGQWGWIEHEVGAPITRALAQLLMEGES